jgi:hypothetical protein
LSISPQQFSDRERLSALLFVLLFRGGGRFRAFGFAKDCKKRLIKRLLIRLNGVDLSESSIVSEHKLSHYGDAHASLINAAKVALVGFRTFRLSF